jgi:hypothetical protein
MLLLCIRSHLCFADVTLKVVLQVPAERRKPPKLNAAGLVQNRDGISLSCCAIVIAATEAESSRLKLTRLMMRTTHAVLALSPKIKLAASAVNAALRCR